MNKQEIFEIVVQHVYEVLPFLAGKDINEHESLINLGANSIDRTEICILTLESLDLEIPLVELSGIASIKMLVDRIYSKLHHV